jgi:predicted kinase
MSSVAERWNDARQHVGMDGGAERPRLVVVSGPTGTGKSTIADALGRALPATVASFDWAMSALRSFPDLWADVELPVERQRAIGWTLLARIAEQQLRRGASVVLDLVARDAAIAQWSEVAARTGAHLAVIECTCSDELVHRSRIDGRSREIPGWYELTWEQVERSRTAYVPLSFEPKLVVSAEDDVGDNIERALTHVRTA